jgi:hypothetical protein
MQLVVILIAIALAFLILGFIISALKWLFIIAAVVVAVGVLIGWRPGRRSTYR